MKTSDKILKSHRANIKLLIYVRIYYLIKTFDIILLNLDTRPEDKTWQKISRVDHKSTIQSF